MEALCRYSQQHKAPIFQISAKLFISTAFANALS